MMGWDAPDVFDRFTERGRQVVIRAQDEVRELAHPHIGTEHLLLGELAVAGGLGGWALESLGVQREAALDTLAALVPPTGTPPARQVPFTEGARCALELSLVEVQSRGLAKVGTEHLLLGVCTEIEASSKDDVAGRLLASLGVTTARIRAALDPFVLDRSAALSWSLRVGPHLEFRDLPGSAWARLLPMGVDLRLRRLLLDSAAVAFEAGRRVVEPRDLLAASAGVPVGVPGGVPASAPGTVPAGAPGAVAADGREWERIEAGRPVLSALVGAGRIASGRVDSGRVASGRVDSGRVARGCGAEAVTFEDLFRSLRTDQRALLGRAGWPLGPAAV
jgi:hypothetical protein